MGPSDSRIWDEDKAKERALHQPERTPCRIQTSEEWVAQQLAVERRLQAVRDHHAALLVDDLVRALERFNEAWPHDHMTNGCRYCALRRDAISFVIKHRKRVELDRD